MASQFSNENFQTDNPFVDKLIKNLKILTYNCIVKDEYQAEQNETTESLEEAELYFLCIENRVTLAAFPYIPEQFMREVGIPERIIRLYQNFNNEINFIPLDNEEKGTTYRSQLVQIMRPWYIDNFEEKNPYYRMLIGRPPLDDWGIPVRDYTKYLPDGFTYQGEFVHEIGVEACKELDKYGVLEIMKNDYKGKSDVRYLDYLTAGISLYDARKAYDFMILYTPSDADAYITDEWKLRYQERRDYLVSHVYSTALEMTQNPYYHSVMQIYLFIMTMVDMLADVQSHIVKKDILDRRCVEYIFSMYGVPYFRAIPYRYQEKICLNLHTLLKYKSSTKVLLELARIFDMEDCEFFKYYLFKRRRMDDNGNFIWSAEEKMRCSTNEIVEEEIRIELISEPPEEQPVPTEFDWYSSTTKESLSLRELKFTAEESSSTAQDATKEALEEEEDESLEPEIEDYHERFIIFPFEYFLQKGNVMVVDIDGLVLREGIDYRITSYNRIRIKSSLVEGAEKITYHFYYDKDTQSDSFVVDTTHSLQLYRYTSEDHTSNTIDLSKADFPSTFWENPQDAIVVFGSIFLCPDTYSIQGKKLILDEDLGSAVGRQVTVLLPYSSYLKSVFEKHDVVALEGQKRFLIPEPFTHYVLHGNGFFVTIGSIFIDPSRYSIQATDDYGKAYIEFVDGTTIAEGRKVVFNFLYSRNAVVNGIQLESLETTFYPTQPFQTEFPLKFPIDNYVGNGYKVYLNVFNHWLAPQAFTYTNNQIVLLDQTISVRRSDSIRVHFVYADADRTKEENSHIIVTDSYTVATTNHQIEFPIHTPLPFYFNKKNGIIVDVNGTPLDPSTYTFRWTGPEDGFLILTEGECSKGQTVNFTFVYNGDSEYLSSMAIQQVSDKGLTANSLIPLEYPFFPYLETGQDFLVIYGSVVVDKKRIHVVDRFNFTIDGFNPNPEHPRSVTILYIYSNWYSKNSDKLGLVQKEVPIPLSSNQISYPVPEPFENYVVNGWPYYVTYGDPPRLMDSSKADVLDSIISSFPPSGLADGTYGDRIWFHFIYLVRAPYVWPELREDFSLTTDLRFCKIPVSDLYSSQHLLNQAKWKEYDMVVHNDGWWAGRDYRDGNYGLIKNAIYDMPFNYSRTKYYGVGRMIELSSYAAKLSFFYAALFDDVFLEEELTVAINSLSETHRFNVAHLILYMTCLTYTFNGIDDVILETPNDVLYASGFNYRASLEDLRSYIISHHYDPESFPIFDMIIPTAQISDLGEFINLQRNNEEVYHLIRNRMVNAQDYREYQIWKHLYDALMTWRFNTDYYKLKNGKVATTYTEFLKEKDPILYASLMQIRSMTDKEKRIDAISTMVSDICYILEEYIESGLARSIFSEFAGYSTSSILNYMMQVIEFFKSYKIIFNEKGEVIDVGSGGIRTINEDSVLRFYDYTDTRAHSKIVDYVEVLEDVHTTHTTRAYEGLEENEQGNGWFHEDCQIITHHADGTEEIIDVD